jgi:SAM-dependent methyltransferase
MNVDQTRSWYENSYLSNGLSAQRAYPNEELCRFIGREYADKTLEYRSKINCLEVGCGPAGNTWMLSEQGFKVTAIDLSPSSLELAELRLKSRNLSSNVRLIESTMVDLPFDSKSYDLIIDVFSSYCLDNLSFTKYLKEASRVLKPGGLIFIYTPSKDSDIFKHSNSDDFIDENTLNGIQRLDYPFYGNNYPFRFEDPLEFEKKLNAESLSIKYLETTSRTYRNRSIVFEWIVCVGQKAFDPDDAIV